MGEKKVLIERKIENGKNIQFKVLSLQGNKIEFESVDHIIEQINSKNKWIKKIREDLYFTRNNDKAKPFSKVEVVEEKYLRSIANDGKTDNINELPEYN